MGEIITDGWLEGEIIRDGILIDRDIDQPALGDICTNDNVVRQLRERGLARKVSK